MRSRTITIMTIDVACLMLALGGGAAAQVRREAAVADSITRNPARVEAALFGPGGYFLISGGVVLHGAAKFVLEQDGRDTPVAASTIVPVMAPGGGMALQYRGTQYVVGMPAGLSCPLGNFTRRDGLIAYTVVKFMNDESPRALIRAGVVRRRIAHEFDGTSFEPLLHAADFADTAPLPSGTGQSIAASINAANDVGAFVLNAAVTSDSPVGSYVNTDLQVTYTVYLMASTHGVDIAGVPLRYYWAMDRSGVPAVFSVEAAAQNWPAGAQLTNWSAPGAKPTQYDVVNFYQVAGLFRQMFTSSPGAFSAFVDHACGG